MAHLFRFLLYLTCILIVACAGILGWALFFEKPFLYYQNLPFPAPQTVRAGEAVSLSVERCNSDTVSRAYNTTHGVRSVETGHAVLLPDVSASIEPGCQRDTSKVNVIPKDTPPGKYTVFGVAQVAGLLRHFEIPWYSEQFEVVP